MTSGSAAPVALKAAMPAAIETGPGVSASSFAKAAMLSVILQLASIFDGIGNKFGVGRLQLLDCLVF